MNDLFRELLPFIVTALALAFVLRNTKSFWRLRSRFRPADEPTVAGSGDAVDLYWRPG